VCLDFMPNLKPSGVTVEAEILHIHFDPSAQITILNNRARCHPRAVRGKGSIDGSEDLDT